MKITLNRLSLNKQIENFGEIFSDISHLQRERNFGLPEISLKPNSLTDEGKTTRAFMYVLITNCTCDAQITYKNSRHLTPVEIPKYCVH